MTSKKKNTLDQQRENTWNEFKDDSTFWKKYEHLLRKARLRQKILQSPPKTEELPSLPQTPPISVHDRLYGAKTAQQKAVEKAKAIVMLIVIVVGLSVAVVKLVNMAKKVEKPVLTGSPKTTLKLFKGCNIDESFKASYDSLRVDRIAWKKHEVISLQWKEQENMQDARSAVQSPTVMQQYAKELQLIRQELKAKKQDFEASCRAYFKQKKKDASKVKDTMIIAKAYAHEIKKMEKELPKHFIPHHHVLRFVLNKEQDSNRRLPRNLTSHNMAVYQLFMPDDTLIYFIKDAHETLHRVRKFEDKFYRMSGTGQLFQVNTSRDKVYQANLFLISNKVNASTTLVKGLKAVIYKQEGKQTQFYIPQSQWLHTHLYLGIHLYAHYD